MPTNTFLNLPIEKKKKIMNAAKSEFVEYSFYDASINRIIKNAGISRGSFYMYFENKEEGGVRTTLSREIYLPHKPVFFLQTPYLHITRQ